MSALEAGEDVGMVGKWTCIVILENCLKWNQAGTQQKKKLTGQSASLEQWWNLTSKTGVWILHRKGSQNSISIGVVLLKNWNHFPLPWERPILLTVGKTFNLCGGVSELWRTTIL